MSGSKFLELIRQQAALMVPRGIELATVISPPPTLIIRVDNMEINLDGDDLIVCEHLLDHQVEYSTDTVPRETATVTVYTRLKAGDRVAVQALPGGQQYLVIDKVVEV